MAETVSLEFIGAQLERVLAEQAAVREDIHGLRDEIRVLTAIVLRHGNTLADILGRLHARVSRHARFNDRLHRLEEQPAQ